LGFVGYGVMGERLLRAALNHDEATLSVAGVWDPSPAAMARLGRDFPRVPRLPSVDALIEGSDCLYIASPPASHLGYAQMALDRCRAIFCEKPLAVSLDEAQAFVEAVEDRNGRAAVNFPFASSFAVDQLKAWMTDGTTGAVQSVDIEVAFARWPRPWQEDAAGWLDRRVEGGFTREVVSHFLFLTRRLIGPLALEESSVSYPEAEGSERAVRARLTAGSVPITLAGAVGTTEKADHNLWVMQGDAGSIRLRDWAFAERKGSAGDWTAAPGAVPNEEARPLVLRRQLDKVSAMARGEMHDLATVREAFEVQKIVEAILKA
jgi:predicted dehydrogenase